MQRTTNHIFVPKLYFSSIILTHNRSPLEKFLSKSNFVSEHLTTIFTYSLINSCSPLLRFNNSRPLSNRLLSISSKSDWFHSYDDFQSVTLERIKAPTTFFLKTKNMFTREHKNYLVVGIAGLEPATKLL